MSRRWVGNFVTANPSVTPAATGSGIWPDSQHPRRMITKTAFTPTGPSTYGSAPGIWRMDEVAYWVKQGLWPNPAVTPDSYFPYVSLLLSSTSLSNANNNLFVDSSGAFNPVSRNGNPTQGSFTPYSTNWSNYFDGSGDYLSVSPTALSTGDFTFECWIYPTSTGQYQYFYDTRASVNDAAGFCVIYNHASYPNQISIYSNGFIGTPTITVSANTWTHFALVRSGGSWRTFVNGVADISPTSVSRTLSNTALKIGAGQALDYFFNGYLSNYRIVNGTAVYTAAFTPPTSPLTAISGTSLLTCQSNRFRDASSNNFTITPNGNTSVQDFGPFSPAYPGLTTYNQSDITNWSGYFDGTGDNLVSPSSTAFAFGTGDYTIECWIYPISTQANMRLWQFSDNNDNADINIGSTGSLNYYNGSTSTTSAGGLIPAYAWTHIAIVRSSSTVRGYVNGAQVLSQATNPNTTSARTLSICGATDDFFFEGYISNFRVVKGTAVYTSAFTPPTTPLTAVSGTSLLTLQNAAFTDNSTNNFVITQNGNPTVTGNSPFNTVGFWSNYFDGSGDYLQAPDNAAFAFGTGDYTVEAWVYPTSIRNGENLIYATEVTQGMALGFTQTYVYIGARATGFDLQATYTMPTNQWVHVAATRQSGAARIFVNGTQIGTGTITRSCPQGSGAVGDYPGATGNGVTGYVSNVRVVKGTALYTANFTVPTAPLTAVSGTSLLTCQNGRFIDNSTNNFTLTVNGNTSVQSFDPFYTTTIGSNGGSMYFDGGGDYLQSNQPSYALGSGDWTVDFWFYAQPGWTAATYDQIVGTLGTDASTGGWRIGSNFAGNGRTLWFTFTNGGYNDIWASANISDGAWHHIAVVRQSGTVRLYRDGVQTASGACTVNFTKTNLLVARTEQSGNSGETQCYVSNLRILKGTCLYPSGTTFTPPTAPVSPSPATNLLLNGMNAGVYDATTINNLETVGNAQVSTSVKKFGTGSIYLDGAGDYLVYPNDASQDMGTGNFTYEMWINVASIPSFGMMWSVSSQNNYLAVMQSGAGFVLDFFNGTTDVFSSTVLSYNTWYHVACTRSNGTVRWFVNGVQDGSGTITTSIGSSTGTTSIGRTTSYGGNFYYFNGYIDDLRITKGVARYTANFTPPTQAFPTY